MHNNSYTVIFSGSGDFHSSLGAQAQSFYLQLTKWSCQDECRYNCMWKTVRAFSERKWDIPQFHGKVIMWHYMVMSGIMHCFCFLVSNLQVLLPDFQLATTNTWSLYHVCSI